MNPDEEAEHIGKRRPWGLRWRSSTTFILTTVGVGFFSDLFSFSIIIPILPFILRDRLHFPDNLVQSRVSYLLGVFGASSAGLAPIAGILADQWTDRRLPFLMGLLFLFLSTGLFFLGQRFWVLLLARILQGSSAAVIWTVGSALTLETVGPNNLGKSFGTVLTPSLPICIHANRSRSYSALSPWAALPPQYWEEFFIK